jgi:hypothetical protein
LLLLHPLLWPITRQPLKLWVALKLLNLLQDIRMQLFAFARFFGVTMVTYPNQ